jgi:Ca2+-binding EF-hand superfamily protein
MTPSITAMTIANITVNFIRFLPIFRNPKNFDSEKNLKIGFKNFDSEKNLKIGFKNFDSEKNLEIGSKNFDSEKNLEIGFKNFDSEKNLKIGLNNDCIGFPSNFGKNDFNDSYNSIVEIP